MLIISMDIFVLVAGDGLVRIQSCCGGRQLPDKSSAQRGPPPRCAELEAGVCRRPQLDCIRATAAQALEGQREPMGGWSARTARTRCRASRSCRGRWRGLPRDALERYVRVACVSLSRSVSSHENARVPHTAMPWQALGSLQPVLHESIIAIPSLRDSWAVTVALDSE